MADRDTIQEFQKGLNEYAGCVGKQRVAVTGEIDTATVLLGRLVIADLVKLSDATADDITVEQALSFTAEQFEQLLDIEGAEVGTFIAKKAREQNCPVPPTRRAKRGRAIAFAAGVAVAAGVVAVAAKNSSPPALPPESF